MTSGDVGTLFAGKRALVTGGANGIGATIVHRLADAGATGAVIDLPHAVSGSPPAGWSAVSADVSDEAKVETACSEVAGALGGLDVVVAAAGVVPPWRSVGQLDLDEWDDVFRVNVRGVAATIKHAVGCMASGSAIVVIASLTSWQGDPNLTCYAASKHAVLGIVRSAALDLGPFGIRANAVAPGPVATEAMLGRMRRRESDGGLPVATALEAAAQATALRRIATVEEVASATLFLASELAAGITGHLLPVDCGLA